MLGVASYRIGVVASEGRVTNVGWPKRVIREDHRNIHRLRTGWVTGSVILPPLEQMYDAIAPLAADEVETIAARVRDVATEAATSLGDRAPASVEELARGRLFVVGAQPDGCHTVTEVKVTGELLSGSYLQVNVPPELWDHDGPDGRVVEPYRAAQEEFERTWWAWGQRPLPLRIHAIARLFQRVSELCGPNGTVNDRVELGVIRGEVRENVWVPICEYLPPTPAGEILAASDDELLGMLEPSTLEPANADR